MTEEEFLRQYKGSFPEPYPINFYCTECGNRKFQKQERTQRYGYPICCNMTMVEDKDGHS